MILKSISINGFKSFGKKVTIDLTHNVTGVVGPNGSGKSNVAEAIRFVLGEQSMKNMRGKLSSDLIYKGSNSLNALNRASVDIYIDNKNKVNGIRPSHDLAAYLEYDEIKLSREVYIDGESKYKINDATVRLRDVTELLALAGIGHSAHTIINQGEADRILLASNKDRKEIVEDALGLKVYHLRIKESEKKLLKVQEHKKEIDIIKGELKPRLYELSRMVKIIQARKEEIYKLAKYVRYYVHREACFIKNRLHELDHVMGQGLDDRYIHIDDKDRLNARLVEIVKSISESHDESSHALKLSLNTTETEYQGLNNQYNELRGKKQALTQIQLDISQGINEGEKADELVSFARSEISIGKDNIDKKLDNAIYNAIHNHNAGAISNIGDAKLALDTLLRIEKRHNKKIIDYSDEIYELEKRLEDLEHQRHAKSQELSQIKQDIDSEGTHKYNILKEKSEIENKLREIEYTIKLNAEEKLRLADKRSAIDVLWKETTHICGADLLLHKDDIVESDELYIKPIVEIYRMIERSRIRIDDDSIADTTHIMREYDDMIERDTHLTREIDDISRTETELRALIANLREILKEDFKKGIEKISFVFNNYFHEVFGGGKAKLSLVSTRKILDTHLSGSLSGGEGGGEASGDSEELIIDVSLPEKKVKDLHMLSGGERSLVSIALIFAMSSIAPPPFIVLDETDAALDEINAKRYGQMLDKLAEKSKLLVITHNRATMNECDVLYGVTIGSDGTSKILSIKFEK